jgi:hypothetical protein
VDNGIGVDVLDTAWSLVEGLYNCAVACPACGHGMVCGGDIRVEQRNMLAVELRRLWA